jgi:hypothetical protein
VDEIILAINLMKTTAIVLGLVSAALSMPILREELNPLMVI